VVHRGDSLWAIAAAHLPAGATAADVTRAWHAWWRHNRTVIGDDPDLILPGQRLHFPVAALAQPTHTPTPGGAR
jgi:nucleoid-associated protein YgaU